MSRLRLRHVEELAEQWVREGVASAMVLLAARRGRIVLHRAFGRLTPDVDAPPTPLDALFPIASITKVFTATALMILVEQGRVGLNRPVSGYIPDFEGEGKDAVLVRHLLTHTSGINGEALDEYAKSHRAGDETVRDEESLHPLLNEFLSQYYRAPLWKPPGQEMSYCDFNLHLAAEIVRRVSGMPLDRFAHASIFEPLAMRGTFYCLVDVPPERRVRRVPLPGREIPAWGDGPPFDRWTVAAETERLYDPAGSIHTSALDMAIFGQMFLNGGAYGETRVLSPATVGAMTRNQIPGIGAEWFGQRFPEASWGFGWSVHDSKSGECGGLYSPDSYEHWGSGGTYFWCDPERQLVGVYLTSAKYRDSPFSDWTRDWRHDLFADAVTAAIVES